MYTSPSMDDLLLGLLVALGEEVAPHVSTPKAQATVAMMQSIVMELRQMLPVYDAYLADEHNATTAVLRSVADTIGDARGAEADRIRQRAATLGQRPDLPAPPDRAAVMAAHREVGESLVGTLRDLDALQRAGDARADEAVLQIRALLGPRILRDVATLTVGGGMVGRG